MQPGSGVCVPSVCVHAVSSGTVSRLVKAPDGALGALSENSVVVRSVGPALRFMPAKSVPPCWALELPHGAVSFCVRSNDEVGSRSGQGCVAEAETVLVVAAVSPASSETVIELLLTVELKLDDV